MLRIGKKKKLAFQKSKRLITSDLLRGLSIALFFHLALFLGFHISSPPNPDLSPLIDPVSVEIDLGTPLTTHPLQTQLILSPLPQFHHPISLEIPIPVFRESPSSLKKNSCVEEPNFTEIEMTQYEFLGELEEDD